LYIDDQNLHVVEAGPYTERYSRVALQDIPTITHTPTHTAGIFNAMAGCAVIVLGMIGFMQLDNPWGAGFLFFFAAMPLLALLINSAFGPTCRCHMHTAVHAHDLTSLRRVRSANRALPLLDEAIRRVQGPYPEAEPEVEPPESAAAYSAAGVRAHAGPWGEKGGV